jgi:hypothetical protein
MQQKMYLAANPAGAVLCSHCSERRVYAATSAVALLLALNAAVVVLAVCRLAGLDWEQLSLDTLFVDPPRAGLDPATEQMLQDFQQVRHTKYFAAVKTCCCYQTVSIALLRNTHVAHGRAAQCWMSMWLFLSQCWQVPHTSLLR